MIHWSKINDIGYITFDSKNKNALSYTDLCSLKDILENDTLTCNGLIITGTNYSFCSGLDLSSDNVSILLPLFENVLSLLNSLPIPVVCALNGHAIGGGLLILCCSDYIIGLKNEKAKYGLPEITLGIPMSKKMLIILFNKLPTSFVEQMLYTGSLYNQETLSKYTHLNLVESKENLMIESEKIINKIAKLEVFRRTKFLIRNID